MLYWALVFFIVAVVAGGVAKSTLNAVCFVLIRSCAWEWQLAQLAAAKSISAFLRAGSVMRPVWHCSQDWR